MHCFSFCLCLKENFFIILTSMYKWQRQLQINSAKKNLKKDERKVQLLQKPTELRIIIHWLKETLRPNYDYFTYIIKRPAIGEAAEINCDYYSAFREMCIVGSFTSVRAWGIWFYGLFRRTLTFIYKWCVFGKNHYLF